MSNSARIICNGGIRAGKTQAAERTLAAFLKKNPKATVMTVKPGGDVRVEIYAGSSTLAVQQKEGSR